MPIKTSQQLFGDDGANGPKAPVSQSPAAGLGADNRAIAFNEELTSSSANRATYALSLNDEDLDRRVTAFENGGLDTVYRLGLNNQAGGGRVIHPDGGAVETQLALAESYASDVANAHLRVNQLDDSIDGAVALDVVSKSGVGQGAGAALFSLLDRRSLILSTYHTVFEETQRAILNENNAAPDSITLIGAGRWTTALSSDTDVLVGIDLIEVLEGEHAGVYVLRAITSQKRAQLWALSGQVAVFASDTEVPVRLFRPVVSAAGRSGTERPSHGLRVVGLPGDQDAPGGLAVGALELVAGGRDGRRSNVLDEGLRYALRTRVVSPSGQHGMSGSITAAGGFEAESVNHLNPYAGVAIDFGWPGFRFDQKPDTGPTPIGFLAQSTAAMPRQYGFLSQVRAAAPVTGMIQSNNTVRLSFEGRRVPRDVALPGAPGLLVEVTVGASSYGTLRVRESYLEGAATDNGTTTYTSVAYRLEQLDGTPHEFPQLGQCTMHFYAGAVMGRTHVTSRGMAEFRAFWEEAPSPPGERVNAMEIAAAPSTEAPGAVSTALRLSTARANDGFLIVGANGPQGDSFTLTADGFISAMHQRLAGHLHTNTARVADTLWTNKLEVNDVTVPGALTAGGVKLINTPVQEVSVPQALWSSTGLYANSGSLSPGWLRLVDMQSTLDDFQYKPPDRSYWLATASTFRSGDYPTGQCLNIPISGFVPYGARIVGYRIAYDAYYPDFSGYWNARVVRMTTDDATMARIPFGIEYLGGYGPMTEFLLGGGGLFDTGMGYKPLTIDLVPFEPYVVTRTNGAVTFQIYNPTAIARTVNAMIGVKRVAIKYVQEAIIE
jgi:hypothetical protein